MALHDLFDPDSEDFLGTGVSLEEVLAMDSDDLWKRSWARQGREERKRRLGLVRKLVLELERVRAATNFATRLGEAAIEDVICGRWEAVADWIGFFTLDEEREDLRIQQEPVWAAFRVLLKEASAGAPLPAVALPGSH